jgi:hypothetical protein
VAALAIVLLEQGGVHVAVFVHAGAAPRLVPVGRGVHAPVARNLDFIDPDLHPALIGAAKGVADPARFGLQNRRFGHRAARVLHRRILLRKQRGSVGDQQQQRRKYLEVFHGLKRIHSDIPKIGAPATGTSTLAKMAATVLSCFPAWAVG